MTFLFYLIGISAFSQQNNNLIGYWKSCDEGDNMIVNIQLDSTNSPVGYLVGFQKENGEWEKDKPKKGIKVLYGFKYDGNLKWNKGKIHDPITKRTYKGTFKMINKNLIKATGYWALFWDDINYKRINLEE